MTYDHATAEVIADSYRFKQVLIDLLSNAVKYNRVGGSIFISCEPSEAGGWRVAVTDTGHGTAPELIDRVFVPFDRLDAEAARRGGHWHRPVAQRNLRLRLWEAPLWSGELRRARLDVLVRLRLLLAQRSVTESRA